MYCLYFMLIGLIGKCETGVVSLFGAFRFAAAAVICSLTDSSRGYDCCMNCYNKNQKGLFVVVGLFSFQWLLFVVPFLIPW